MNLFKPIIMTSVLSLAATSCSTAKNESEEIIERPEISVVDGKFTPELLEAFGRVSDPKLSQDGKKILYGITFESLKLNKGNRELWTMDIDGSNAKRITTTAQSEQNAVWIENGNKIAFIGKQEDKAQIFVMNADGSDRKVISELENGVDGFVISPDEKNIVIISSVKNGEDVKAQYPDLDKSSGRIIDDLMYKHWDEWVSNIPHPFIAKFDTNKIKDVIDIMEGEPFESPVKPFGGIESLAWSPDSKKIVYVSRKKTGLEYSISTNSDLYEYNLATKTTKNITEGMMGYDTNPAYSPSGKYIAWLSMEHDGYESDKNRIFIMDTESGNKTDLTLNWDYTADRIAWNQNEKSIYFAAPYHGSTPIFSIDINTCAIDTIANGQYDFADIVPINENRLIALRHSMLEPNEIFLINSDKSIKELTEVNTELLAKLAKVEIQKVMVPTTDGKEMLTWVILPPNFDASKKYPTLLYCQGGPQQPVSQFWSYRWNFRLMASQGYIIIAPNRRGLPGFGTEWNAQISGDYGGQNMQDYFAAVDYMKKESYIDSDHIGAIGASYGGFSVYWLAGNHNKRFAAFLAHAGIFNTESQYLETEEMWFANWDLGGAFWDKDNKTAQKSYANSPHKFISKWDTPIMITVGEKDYRILASQGMMAFNAAKLRGIPTRMLVFPDENHWILKPQNALLWQREFFKWMDRWLKPQQADKK
ncbi:MAG: S9 family peptidase [Muribaculaceae bacterium]|nr:S9 family peptidase [Muribaculaceae bacterium]